MTLIPLHRAGSLGVRDLGLRRVPGARSVGLALLALLAVGLWDLYWRRAVHLAPLHNPDYGISGRSGITIVLAGFAAAVSVLAMLFCVIW